MEATHGRAFEELDVILEGILTTRNPDGTTNVAPMGPAVDSRWRRFVLRPFQSSRTYSNLIRTRRCVMHVVDDVELLARAAIGATDPPPPTRPTDDGLGDVLTDACRWFDLRVADIDDRPPRATMVCDVQDRGRLRDFFGLNRAMHAVVEAAILATRIDFLPVEQVLEDFSKLQVLVDKTGGERERRAFELLRTHVEQNLSGKVP